MLLTKTNTFIIGPVATLLGFIMNAIFIFLSSVFHVENPLNGAGSRQNETTVD